MTVVATLVAAYNPEDIRPGWIALLIVIALAVATYFLWRSMNTQLRRIDVPTHAELTEQGQVEDPADAGAGTSEDNVSTNGTGSVDPRDTSDD